MTLRTAAVLGLLALCCSCSSNKPPDKTWELLVPPPAAGSIYAYNYTAPLGDWQRQTDRGFGSQSECWAEQAQVLTDWGGQSQGYKNEGGEFAAQIARLRAGQCVATDDPRLGGGIGDSF